MKINQQIQLQKYTVHEDIIAIKGATGTNTTNQFHMDIANIYLFKFNNKNTRKMCEIFSKLTIKTPERCQRRRFGVFIVNFEHIS